MGFASAGKIVVGIYANKEIENRIYKNIYTLFHEMRQVLLKNQYPLSDRVEYLIQCSVNVADVAVVDAVPFDVVAFAVAV